MKKYDTLIFDLDGTLLNTLEDLMDSVNFALKGNGLPERTLDEIRSFVGNGVENLVRRSAMPITDEKTLEGVLAEFKKHYAVNCENKTALYPGIKELLETLKSSGYKIAIVTNKHQEAVKPLYESYFEGVVDVAIGQQEAYRKKPDPDGVFLAIQALEADRETSVYIGDSEVDFETAKRANLPCILVTWGFRDRAELEAIGGEYFVDTPNEILDFIGFEVY